MKKTALHLHLRHRRQSKVFALPLLHFPVLAPIVRPTACLLLATTLRLLPTEDFPEEDQPANERGRQSEAKG